MEITAIICMLLGACMLHPLHVVIQRKLQKDILTVRGALVYNYGAGAVLAFTAIWWWDGFAGSLGLKSAARNDPSIFWIAVFWTTSWNIFISYANAKSRELAEVSLTQPFQGLTPGLIAIAALVFNEWPSRIGIAGIFFITTFTYIHGREGSKKISDWFMPFRALLALPLPENYSRLPESKKMQALAEAHNQRCGIRWAFASACAGTMGLLGDGLASRHGNIAVCLSFQFGVITFWNLFLTYIWNKNPEPIYKAGKSFLDSRLLLSLLGPLNIFSYFMISTSYRLAPIAYIGSMKRLNIIGVALFAYWLLNEKKGWRLVTAAGITFGAILLGVDPRGQAYVLGSAEDYAYRLKSIFRL